MNKLFLASLLFFTTLSSTTNAQLLEDPTAKEQIKKGLDKLYNFEFESAEVIFKPIKKKYEHHPVTDLLSAIQLQWKYLGIENNPTALNSYITHLKKCRQKAEILFAKPDHKAEATFFMLASHGYIALSYNYQKEFSKASNEARQAYGYLKDGFKFTDKNPDFNFTTGIYNFYRIQYPITHPVVKPVMVFFEGGNKSLGKKQLAVAVEESIFVRTEAASYLANIYVKYEKDFKNGLKYTAINGTKYPNNPIFRIKYIEALLLNQQFEKANQLLHPLSTNISSIHKIIVPFFRGYEAEINQKNDKIAAGFYAKALQEKPDARNTDEYYAQACLGMGNIMQRANDKEKARYFYKKCLAYAEYTWVIEEAKKQLSTLQ